MIRKKLVFIKNTHRLYNKCVLNKGHHTINTNFIKNMFLLNCLLFDDFDTEQCSYRTSLVSYYRLPHPIHHCNCNQFLRFNLPVAYFDMGKSELFTKLYDENSIPKPSLNFPLPIIVAVPCRIPELKYMVKLICQILESLNIDKSSEIDDTNVILLKKICFRAGPQSWNYILQVLLVGSILVQRSSKSI